MSENKEKTFAGEQLDLEQLEEVSGGSCKELSQDSKELSKLGLCNAYNVGSLAENINQRNEILGAWKKAGVDVNINNYAPNQYFINGEKVTRTAALSYIRKNRKR